MGCKGIYTQKLPKVDFTTLMQNVLLIMAALWNRACRYIFALWFLSCFFMVALCNRADHYIFIL